MQSRIQELLAACSLIALVVITYVLLLMLTSRRQSKIVNRNYNAEISKHSSTLDSLRISEQHDKRTIQQADKSDLKTALDSLFR